MPYFLRTGDKWTKIDYSKKAEEWMKPLERGHMTGLVEIPANWYLDDLPPMVCIPIPFLPFLPLPSPPQNPTRTNAITEA